MTRFEVTRRGLLTAAGLGIIGAGLIGCAPGTGAPRPSGQGQPEGRSARRRLGAEWESHELTVMSWPTALIWGRDVRDVRDDIAGLARAIAEFEPVIMLASPGEEKAAASACGSEVEVVVVPVDDLWARDTVPVFVEGPDGLSGVDFSFNGWGDKQEHPNDGRVARRVLTEFNIPRISTDLVSEGGSFETDGLGTLMVTESSIVNDNRNPGLSRDDITDAHVDSLARFTAPGVVLLDTPGPGAPEDVWSRSTAQARSVLAEATDASGGRFEVIDLPQPDFDEIRGGGDDFLSSYVNFYVGNGAVYLPEFGDRRADDRAQGILREQFPGREIVPVTIDTIASGGRGIHCATHDLPGEPEDY